MNIFYLSENPKIAAIEHVDKHVVKMILETAQLLCTAHRVLDGVEKTISTKTKNGKNKNVIVYSLDAQKDALFYKTTHKNHPCAIWARQNINNYMWLYQLFVELCNEYTFRYGKTHRTDFLLRKVLATPPTNISNDGFTPPPQAMPEQYKHTNPVTAYRQYYIGAKKEFAKWSLRPTPEWFNIGV